MKFSKNGIEAAKSEGYTEIAVYLGKHRYSVQGIEAVLNNGCASLPELYDGLRVRDIDWTKTILGVRVKI